MFAFYNRSIAWLKLHLKLVHAVGLSIVVGLTIVIAALLSSQSESRTYFFFRSPSDYIDLSSNIDRYVNEAIGLLKASPPLKFETASGTENGALVRKQIALALVDRRTGQLFEKRIWVREADISRRDLLGVVPVFNDDPKDDFRVRVAWWNSYNSVYEVTSNPDYIVLANKYLVDRDYLPEQQNILLSVDGPRSRYVDMTYVPYSESIHWSVLAEAGKRYINAKVDAAYDELLEQKVESLSQPGKLVVDVVPKDMVKTIALVEHVDPTLMRLSNDNGRSLVERVLVILGGNQEWAYRYTASSAGASGLTQFIESTYDYIRDSYPRGTIFGDYRAGMADHVNALKSTALFIDAHTKVLNENITNAEVKKRGVTEEMLSATYNGGAARVIRSVNERGYDWYTSDIFPEETENYVEKYRTIKAMNIFADAAPEVDLQNE